MVKVKGGSPATPAVVSGNVRPPAAAPKRPAVRPPPQRRAAPPPVPAAADAPVTSQLRRYRKTKLDFYEEVAEKSGVPDASCRKVLDAVFELCHAGLRDTKTFKLPQLATFRLREVPKREAGTKRCFGKEVVIKPRDETSKVLVLPCEQLRKKLGTM